MNARSDDAGRIAHIDLFRISLPFETGGPRNGLRPGMAPWLDMESLLVRVQTRDGVTGWGEAFGHFVNPGTYAVLESLVAPWFLGQDAGDIAGLSERAQRSFFGFGRGGPVLYALSAIDIALWDIAARRAGLPLFRFLGGSSPALQRYASLVRYGSRDAVMNKVREVVDLGYTLVKLHEAEPACFEAAVEAAGGKAKIALDVNCPWDRLGARAVASQLDPRDYAWLEEPVWPPEDFDGLAALRGTGTAIAAGENIATLMEFRRAFELGALDIVQPSVVKVGGITVMREILALAKAHGVRCVPHCYYYGAGYLATAHLLASQARPEPLETGYIELAGTPNPAFDPKTARLTLSDELAGLGFDPRPDELDRWTIATRRIA